MGAPPAHPSVCPTPVTTPGLRGRIPQFPLSSFLVQRSRSRPDSAPYPSTLPFTLFLESPPLQEHTTESDRPTAGGGVALLSGVELGCSVQAGFLVDDVRI